MSEQATYNQSQIIAERPGWTKGRVEKFLVVEHEHHKRGYYGRYVEYEYSLPQILDAEKSEAWRKAAAKYLRTDIAGLDAALAERGRQIAEWKAEAAAREAELEAQIEREEAARQALRQAEIERTRGGLTLAGYREPLRDGWRTFTEEQIMPFVSLREKALAGPLDSATVVEHYRLWKLGSGYCNPLGSVRKIIAPVKEKIMALMLDMAKEKGWQFGCKDGVLYIDTPGGQVSFHLRVWESDKYPPYAGEWSGLRNSDEIIAKLVDQQQEAASQAA